MEPKAQGEVNEEQEDLNFAEQFGDLEFFKPKQKEIQKLAKISEFMKQTSSSEGKIEGLCSDIKIHKKKTSYSVDKTTLYGINCKISNHESEMFLKQNFK